MKLLCLLFFSAITIAFSHDFDSRFYVSQNEKFIFDINQFNDKSVGSLYKIIYVHKNFVQIQKIWEKPLTNKTGPKTIFVLNNGTVISFDDEKDDYGNNTIVVYGSTGAVFRRWYFSDLVKLYDCENAIRTKDSKKIIFNFWQQKIFKLEGNVIRIVVGGRERFLLKVRKPKKVELTVLK